MHIFKNLTMQICSLRDTLSACKISWRPRDRRPSSQGGWNPPPPRPWGTRKSPAWLGLRQLEYFSPKRQHGGMQISPNLHNLCKLIEFKDEIYMTKSLT